MGEEGLQGKGELVGDVEVAIEEGRGGIGGDVLDVITVALMFAGVDYWLNP